MNVTQPLRAYPQSPRVLRADRPRPASWTLARKRPSGGKMPQAIAHRGYRAKHPENTMGAFEGAVKAKAHAIETDIHLTKDDVVVLSHDANLKRCFGKDEKIIDCTWEYVSQQRTLAAPHEPMPRLKDLLEYLACPGMERVWLLLDIKLDNDADNVMRLIAETIQSVAPNPLKPWNQRLVLGCWAVKFLPLCAEYLPTFPITHIGFSIPYARQFLSVPNVSFNMLQKTLLLPVFGARFIRDVKAKGRPIYVWTVNEPDMMRWCINKQVDGVLTDDPERFLEVCDEWEHGKREVNISWREWMMIAWINLMVLIFGTIFWWKYRGTGQGKLSRKRVVAIKSEGE
ncbi:PLC-like phosphodiesterase [Usnea florida]